MDKLEFCPCDDELGQFVSIDSVSHKPAYIQFLDSHGGKLTICVNTGKDDAIFVLSKTDTLILSEYINDIGNNRYT